MRLEPCIKHRSCLPWSQMKCDFVDPYLMVFPYSARRSVASELTPKNVPRVVTPKILTGVFGSNTKRGIIYEWCFLASSVIINLILLTRLVVAVLPSAVSRVTNVGISGPVNNLLQMLIMGVADLSIAKGMTSVSCEKESFLWLSSVQNDLAYRVGIGMHFARRRIPCRTSTFLLSLDKIEAKMETIPV